MATITHDTLDWYGWDDDGAGVHDIIGTRCDPYTNLLLKGTEYHHCCHSNLTRALATERNLPLEEAEVHVHDVMNVFMCTGFTRDTHQYFMKASPVRPLFIEFFAEIDLVVALSACPGGDSARQSLRRQCQMLSAQGRGPSAARERVGWLALTTAEQVFSLAWSWVKGGRRVIITSGSFRNLMTVRFGSRAASSSPG